MQFVILALLHHRLPPVTQCGVSLFLYTVIQTKTRLRLCAGLPFDYENVCVRFYKYPFHMYL